MASDPPDDQMPHSPGQSSAAGTGIAVQPVAFAPLDGATQPSEAHGDAAAGLNRVLDVEVPVMVELGSTQMTIEELLALRPGSVIELTKFATDPVDLVIRDHVVAQGEIIVVQDNFGIRITHIVEPAERASTLR